MPPRYAYWTILIGDEPTAFRASAMEDIMPTFNRLKEKQPTAVLKWFQNGKLWNTRIEAREAMAFRGDKGKRSDPRRQPGAWTGKPAIVDDGAKPQWKPKSDAKPEWKPKSDARPDWKPKGDARREWKPKGKPSSAGKPPWVAKEKRLARPARPEWKPKGDGAPHAQRPDWKPPAAGGRPAWQSKSEGLKRGARPERQAKDTARPEWRPKGAARPEWQPKGAARPEWKPESASKPEWKPKSALKPEWKPKGAAKPEWKPKSSARPADVPSGRPEARDKKWRPGGDHKDPRQKYKDAKKAKWTRFKQAIRARTGHKKKREDE